MDKQELTKKFHCICADKKKKENLWAISSEDMCEIIASYILENFTPKRYFATFCHPENGYEADKLLAQHHLKIGMSYEIERKEIHNWKTDVYLKNFPNTAFNSVLFDIEEAKIDCPNYCGIDKPNVNCMGGAEKMSFQSVDDIQPLTKPKDKQEDKKQNGSLPPMPPVPEKIDLVEHRLNGKFIDVPEMLNQLIECVKDLRGRVK